MNKVDQQDRIEENLIEQGSLTVSKHQPCTSQRIFYNPTAEKPMTTSEFFWYGVYKEIMDILETKYYCNKMIYPLLSMFLAIFLKFVKGIPSWDKLNNHLKTNHNDARNLGFKKTHYNL